MDPRKILAAFCGWSVSPTTVNARGPDPDALPVFSIGGMAGAIVTSPFDVVKTRLQSSLFREPHIAVNVVANGMNGGVLTMPQGRSGLLRHFVETTHIIRCVEKMNPKVRELTVSEGISTGMNPPAPCSRVSEPPLLESFLPGR